MRLRTSLFFITCLLLCADSLRAQGSIEMMGYGSGRITPEVNVESQIIKSITPQLLDTIVHNLTNEVRVAGSPADERSRDYVIRELSKAGLKVAVYPYDVYLPYAQSVSLELIKPRHEKFDLHEPLLNGEPKGPSYPWANGYSGSGTAEGQYVYVNYGLHEDYRLLDSIGVSVKGKIAIARYGGSYRGIKAKLAEEHGAAGLIIYTDPANDGFVTGDVYPNGPMRPAEGIQRGSIFNGHGDPTTPNYSSVPGAKHLPKDQAQELPHIPVMPISYSIAQTLLSEISIGEIPNQSWQGGLPMRYHVGPSDGEVKLIVKTDDSIRRIWNTIVTIEGTEWPDEWVIVGGHRDAWCRGSEDNASGCASAIASAEAFSNLVKQGMRPKRSVLFATWDAEEWGLIGSTEWVEQFEKELSQKGIAYLNQDMCATGSGFGASADPVLRSFIWETTKAIPDPTGGSVFDVWKLKQKPNVPASGPLKIHGGKAEPEIGLLGGGSDFSGFYNHLNIPSTEHGFGGPFGQYHSDHDSYEWTKHFGDTSFAYHAAAAQLLAVEAARLANADILPFDFEELGRSIEIFWTQAKAKAFLMLIDSSEFAVLDTAVKHFRSTADRFNTIRETKALTSNARAMRDEKLLKKCNDQIRKVEVALSRPEGLSTDSWVRNPLVISDPMNGYGELTLPGIQLAIRANDKTKLRSEIEALAHNLMNATTELEKTMQMME